MKKLIYVVVLGLFCSFQQANAQETKKDDWAPFYKFLGDNIKYPQAARLNAAQGNSIILMTIGEGKLKKFTVINANPDLGFDAEVVEKLFAFRDFKLSQSGNYALITAYRLDGSKSPIKNESYPIAKGYKELKLTVMAFANTETGAVKDRIDTIKIVGYGSNSNFIIRDKYALASDANHPLVVLNDEVIEYDGMKGIDPNTIKAVSILKDASATALYGQPAKNGVIIISTKDYVPKKTIK
jgi:TonB-dependent SusC/RagA subfamily outer membrane receptor